MADRRAHDYLMPHNILTGECPPNCPAVNQPAGDDEMRLPRPPRGHAPWVLVSPGEHQKAYQAGIPTAYLESVVEGGTYITHHFVARPDGAPHAGTEAPRRG